MSEKQPDFWSPSSSTYDFGQFNYSSDTVNNSGNFYQQQQQQQQPSIPSASIFTPQIPSYDPGSYGGGGHTNPGDDPYADEPPLLEELGINFEHIMQKTVAVLNPFKQTSRDVLQDADLAGPLVFGLAFGSLLLLSGKVHFSYIYGFGVLGCIMIYSLLILMSPPNVTFSAVFIVSILGYCLLPMVFLATAAIFFSLQSFAGSIMALVVILWCAMSASKLFITALTMQNQQALVAYPCILFYGVFALLALF